MRTDLWNTGLCLSAGKVFVELHGMRERPPGTDAPKVVEPPVTCAGDRVRRRTPPPWWPTPPLAEFGRGRGRRRPGRPAPGDGRPWSKARMVTRRSLRRV
ncbi:hypothetical protein [Nocardiopsis dassonvillei]|uniref:hypothetical protein n=1 Tax=Nocardiopsis dassonvillei TaxID=2014 RepID=UPI003F544DBD